MIILSTVWAPITKFYWILFVIMFVKKGGGAGILEVSKLGSCLQTCSTVYTYTYILCVCVGWSCVHMELCRPEVTLGWCSPKSSTWLFERGSLSIWCSLGRRGWLAGQWVPVFCLSLSPQHWDYKSTTLWLALSRGLWGWNSGLLASMANTFPTELSPQACLIFVVIVEVEPEF